MAQALIFTTWGAVTASKNQSFTSADLPDVLINTVKISEAPLIWRKNLEQDGTQITKNGKPLYIKSNKRGVRILITRTGLDYTGFTNVPTLYFEGDEIAIEALNTYKFLNECTIEYGVTV